jgi:flagellum-specific ATP synthase
VVPAAHLKSAQRFREIYARYSQNSELIKMGAYRRGSDPGVDQALELYPQMDTFLRQDVARAAPLAECVKQMQALLPAAQAKAQGAEA